MVLSAKVYYVQTPKEVLDPFWRPKNRDKMMKKLRWFVSRIQCAFLGHPWGMCPKGYRCTKCDKLIVVED
jgi:hypothetical protein